MSKKHDKWAKHQHRPENDKPPADHGGSEASMAYIVKIEPNFEDKNRYSEEKQYRTDQLDIARRQIGLAWWLNVISGVAGGIAFLAFAAFVYYAGLVRDSNRIAKTSGDLAYRPYIGVDQIVVRFYQGETDTTGTVEPTAQTTWMGITVQVKNFGPVPGTNYVSEIHTFIGDTEIPSTKVADKPATFFPGQVFSPGGGLTPLGYKVVSHGEKLLTMYVKVSYDGPTGHTEECEKDQYLPNVSRFAKLGPCPGN